MSEYLENQEEINVEVQKVVTTSESETKSDIWEETTAYPPKVKFDLNKPVLVTFPKDFTAPTQLPPKHEGDKDFLVFDVLVNGVKSSIMTGAITLIRALKSHDPLAGKSLEITKKNVEGKNFFYVSEQTLL